MLLEYLRGAVRRCHAFGDSTPDVVTYREMILFRSPRPCLARSLG